MSYLSRENSNLSDELWNQIDQTVINTARNVLVSRRFLHIFGPLGIGTESIQVDDADTLDEVPEDGFITTTGRKYVEIPTIYDDFTVLAKDLENSRKFGYPVDLSKAASSAESCSRKEDRFIFFGNSANGYEGLLTASGTNKIKRSDWTSGENAFSDLVKGLEIFSEKGIYGTYALALSPAIGQDLSTAYLEQKDLNHSFRILETALLRIKRRQAITVFE